MESEEHISYSVKKIYTGFKILEGHKNDLFGHLKNVNRILESASKEAWKYDYPEHVDEFRKLRELLIEESVKETKFIKNLADLTLSLHKTIEMLKKL